MTAVPNRWVEKTLQPLTVGIVYEVNRQMFGHCRIIVHEGGTRSGKTYNTVYWLIDHALATPFVEITIASRDMPHLRRGAMKDFLKIMNDRGLYRDAEWHESYKVYKFANGAVIEFLNADEIGKVSGPGRDILFCNECNFIKKSVFDQLLRRTRRLCIIDYNPIHPRHWIYEFIIPRKDCFLWRSTYRDNLKFLPREQVLEIELMETLDPLAWHVYGLGLRGAYQKGQIYGQKPNKPWQPISIKDYNSIHTREVFGLDWGFDPDPNAVLGVKKEGNKRYIRKYIYKRKQENEQLRDELKDFGCTKESIFVADTSDNKSIVWLRKTFPMVYGCLKGPGIVKKGIKTIQPLEVHYAMDPDLEFEYYNYTYLVDPKTEESTGVPQDKHNHLMDCFRMVEQYREYL